ncbi:pyruvate kinase [Gephyromycinifex aptenodytis]|uniref:pyruvate kinase n=1 Tax=Gephyromycinifex aptenodytis TaxID=2716227 RepID=UPI0014485CC6|nr:pyruvate kinase [Gephyromycinifex aptenodytis]
MRRAKIVSTLGPAVNSQEAIRALIDAGLDVARINRSHGSHAEHEQQIKWVHQAAEESGRAIAVLVDLQGPKIRTGRFSGGPVHLAVGAEFTITTDEVDGDATRVGTTFKGLPGDVRPGDTLLIDDGKISLRAVEVTATEVRCEVLEGGMISNNKGINLPGVAVSVPALSEKDEDDLRWALRVGADWIALSFVRDARDIDRLHEIMDEEGIRRPIIAKVEKPQAVANLEEIVRTFDGIMVARGDLGVEMPLEEVPLVQKRAVDLARRDAKPVIVATQVLESMIENSRPTRAEASDCANAVLDGADAIMLSGETSVGSWPVLAVRTMARIIENTEDHGLSRIPALGTRPSTTGGAVTWAAAEIGSLLHAKFLVTFTTSGDTARRMSRVRPELPMLAFSQRGVTRRRLALTWGINTLMLPEMDDTSAMIAEVDRQLTERGWAAAGDTLVVVAGAPHGVEGSTNALQIHEVGGSTS